MKIQVIGTGCISSINNSASILINDHILFDMPNGNLKSMIRQNIDILKIDTVIISHKHADHCFDLPFLLWYKVNFNKEQNLNTKIITDKETRDNIDKLIDLSSFGSAKRAKKEYIDAGEVNNISILDNLKICNFKMKHKGINNAYGYMIEDNNVKVGLTGDTSICEGLNQLAKIVDVLICDLSLIQGNISHMGINNIKGLLNENPQLKIIAIHMYDETRKELEKIKLKNLYILDDGTIFELLKY